MLKNIELIAIKKIKLRMLLSSLMDSLSFAEFFYEDLYVSIIPPIEGICFLEFSDLIPKKRDNLLNLSAFLDSITNNFDTVFYLYNDDQRDVSKYKKFFNGNLLTEYNGKGSLLKGLKYDMIMKEDEVESYIRKIWYRQYSDNDIKPVIYQLLKDNIILNFPFELEPEDFYGELLQRK